jgi:DNA-directed RNA polymerase subunit F
MKIINQTPLPLAEIKSKVTDLSEKKELSDYLKKFSKLDSKKAKALSEEIIALNNVKIKNSDIIKVLDFLPKDTHQVNKIFTDVSLSEEEANAIVETVSKY